MIKGGHYNMAKFVTRSVKTSKIYASIVNVSGGEIIATPLEPIIVETITVTPEKALKLVQKTYGKKNQYVVNEVVETSKTYALETEKFMELAHEVNKEEEVNA